MLFYADLAIVIRIENDNGTAELERIENINISFRGNAYRKREDVLQEEEHQNRSVKEDVFEKKQEYIHRMTNNNRSTRNKEQEILNLEKEREDKRKRAMNKYIEDGAPEEKNSKLCIRGI